MRPLPATIIGVLTGVVLTGVLASMSLMGLLVVLGALTLFLPTLLLSDTKAYWLTLFVLALQLDVKRNLIDGLAVIRALKLETFPWTIVPEIRVSDIPLFALLLAWVVSVGAGRASFRIGTPAWPAIVFLGWAGLSVSGAPHVYLGLVELLRQCKFFLIYLYASNTMTSPRWIKRVWVLLLLILLVQGGVTLARYQFQYFDSPFGQAFGRTESLVEDEREQLLVDPKQAHGLRAAYGTISTPVVTAKFLLISLPFALLLCCWNPFFSRRWIFVALAVIGLLALYVTYSRTSLLAAALVLALTFLLLIRRRLIAPRTAMACVLLALLGGLLLTPKIHAYLYRKEENVFIRFEQYDIAMAMIRDHPVLGVGVNNSAIVAHTYNPESYSPASYLRRVTEQPIHSFYLALLAEIGIVGFLAYLAFFSRIALEALRLSRSSPTRETAFFGAAVFLAIAGLGAGVLTNPLWEDSSQSLAWFLAGMVVALRRQESMPPARPQGAAVAAVVLRPR